MARRRGNTIFVCAFVSVTPSSWSRALEGLFELTRRPLSPLNLALCITSVIDHGIELVTRPAGCQSREVLDQQDENEDEHFESQYLDMGISLATAFTDQNFVLEVSTS